MVPTRIFHVIRRLWLCTMFMCGGPALEWTRPQWTVLMMLGTAHFFNGMCVSIQAPFYPAVAESKGLSSTQYGFVFGIFELVVFVFSPFCGHLMPYFGVTRIFTAGLLITGVMCITFGFLNNIQVNIPFCVHAPLGEELRCGMRYGR